MADFDDLKTTIERVAAAQTRTDIRLDRLSTIVEQLATAQTRTEVRLEELATAQARTEVRLEELATAQACTEVRLEELVTAQARTEIRLEELATAQARTDARVEQLAEALTLFRRTFTSQMGSLGARWGLQTEEAFRDGIRTILEEIGFTTERFLTWDAAGEVFGHPDQVGLDVVVYNGKVIVVEIKSSLDRANTYLFDRKVEFYTRHTGRQVHRKVVVAPYADERAKEVARRLGIEVCTEAAEFK